MNALPGTEILRGVDDNRDQRNPEEHPIKIKQTFLFVCFAKNPILQLSPNLIIGKSDFFLYL